MALGLTNQHITTNEVTMLKRFNSFLSDENGAVTVDWVVLTAAVVALAGVAFTAIQTSSGGVGTGVGNYLTGVQPG